MPDDTLRPGSAETDNQSDTERTPEDGIVSAPELEGSIQNSTGSRANSEAVPASKNRKKSSGRPKGAKNRPDIIGKAKIAKILKLSVQGVPRAQIARIEGVSKAAIAAVRATFKPVFKDLENVDNYKACKADLLDAAQLTSLQSLVDPDKHAEASLNAAAYAFDVLYKAGRLERGQSTSNASVHYFERSAPSSAPDKPEIED